MKLLRTRIGDHKTPIDNIHKNVQKNKDSMVKICKKTPRRFRGEIIRFVRSDGYIDISAHSGIDASLHCCGIKHLNHSLAEIFAGIDNLGKDRSAYIVHCGRLFEADGHIYKAHIHMYPPGRKNSFPLSTDIIQLM